MFQVCLFPRRNETSLQQQPLLNESEWAEKAASFGIHLGEGSCYLPVLALPERIVDVESRFGGAHLVQFVLDNTLNESISTEGCVNLSLDERHAILLFPFHITLKRNVHEEIRTALRQAQQAFHQYMRIDLSLYIGELCNDLPSLKKQILTFWMVNLVMELELKYIVMQHFVSNFKAELLHLGERISMEEMAGRLNLNASHFSRLFKKETGETFVEFVTRSKVERARELLDTSDASIEQIAEQLGFEHTSYFIKLFRGFTQLSPSEYRRKM